MKVVRGGFQVRPEDQSLVNTQRALTKAVNEKFVQVGATFLKPASKHPVDDDWFKKLRGDTDLQGWVDTEELQTLNVGFNLQFGWMDVDIDSADPDYNKFIIAAMEHLGVDTRFRFGRISVGCPTHVLVQLPEDESAVFEDLRKFEPREFRLASNRYHCQLRSFPTNIDAKNVARSAKQTVVPGSLYSPKQAGPREYDLSVWYGQDGVASSVTDIASTTARRSSFTTVVRAVAFGTVAYLLRDHWIEGQRQLTATKVTGWLARVVKDSQAMNGHEAISSEVFCPIDTDSWAEQLLHFICDQFNDEEKHMRVRAYSDAVEKLSRNPDAKIPGWHSMSELIGAEAMVAVKTVLMPGSDVSKLSAMAERYIYDESDNKYIDRERHIAYGQYVHDGNELERRHKGDVIFIGGKPKEAFKVFESSTMRKRIGVRDMFPDLDPGAIYRMDVMRRVVPDESDTNAIVIFNTWKGWPIQPIPVNEVDPELMAECEAKLDRLLDLITRDNKDQCEWLKDWIAWIFQHPGQKQQIAPVIVGGQGVGKSFFGNVFMKALLTERLWGSAAPKILEGAFTIGPFKDKMFVFIDEAKFHGESGTDEIKKLIRNTDISGQEKFEEARDYRIYARIMFASNRFDMNIGQADVRDRALFYTRAYDKDHLKMSEMEFRTWAERLKPFFDEFGDLLRREDALRHYIRMFVDRPVNRHKLESIELSSSNDPEIVASNMTWVRRLAKAIIESEWIAADDLSIEYPFEIGQLNARVIEECKAQGMKPVQGARVLNELRETGLVEPYVEDGRRLWRFVAKWGTACQTYEKSTGVTLSCHREFTDNDMGVNDCTMKDRRKRVGSRPSLSGKF